MLSIPWNPKPNPPRPNFAQARVTKRRRDAPVRVLGGELDRTADIMPEKAPPCNDALVGKELEIRWRYWRPTKDGERGNKKAVDIWCVGTVVRVANGTTD